MSNLSFLIKRKSYGAIAKILYQISKLFRVIVSVFNADETEGRTLSIRGTGRLKGARGPGPDYVSYVCIFLDSIIVCRWYKLTFQTQSKSLRKYSQSFRYSAKIFSRSALARGPEKNFSPGPEPDLGGHVSMSKDYAEKE
jgi:hypothetical protein